MPRKRFIKTYLYDEEYERMVEAAKAKGQTYSSWARAVLLDALNAPPYAFNVEQRATDAAFSALDARSTRGERRRRRRK